MLQEKEKEKEKLKEVLKTANKAHTDAKEVMDKADKNRVAANTTEQQVEIEAEKKIKENDRTERSKEKILQQEQAQLIQNQNMDQGSLMDSFKQAMQYFGPQLGGYLLSGGRAGGMKKAAAAYQGYLDFKKSQQPDIVEEKVKKYQQVQGLRDKYGRPLKFDPETGQWIDVQGSPVTKDFIDPISERKASTDAKKFRKDVLSYGKQANDDFQKLAADSIKAIQAGKKAYKLIESNSKLAPSFAARALARLSGEQGRMTDQDVAAFQGDPSLLGKFSRTYERAVSGTMTAEDKKIMMDAINRLSDVEAGFAKEMGQAVAKRMGTVKGALLNQEELEEYLLGGFDFGAKKKEQPANEDEEIQDIFKKYGL